MGPWDLECHPVDPRSIVCPEARERTSLHNPNLGLLLSSSYKYVYLS